MQHGGGGPEVVERGGAEAAGRRPHLGQGVHGHAEEVAQLGGPGAGARCRTAGCGWRWRRRWRRCRPRCRRSGSTAPSCRPCRRRGRDGRPGGRGRRARRSQAILVAVKYGSSTRPVVARTKGRWPASASSAHRAAVRRSCQTMARCRGRPVERSKATRVSRWLVMPMAATVSPARPGGPRPRPGWRARRPRSRPRRAPPSRAGGSAGSAPGRRRRSPGPARRRPGRAPRSCPRRWRRPCPWGADARERPLAAIRRLGGPPGGLARKPSRTARDLHG